MGQSLLGGARDYGPEVVVMVLDKGNNYMEFDITIGISVKNHLILPEGQIYSPLLVSKISDFIFVLNFLFSGNSGEGKQSFPCIHAQQATGRH